VTVTLEEEKRNCCVDRPFIAELMKYLHLIPDFMEYYSSV
jgi:hypothetical protein